MARRPSQQQLFRELMAKFGLEVASAYLEAIKDLTKEVELQKLVLALEHRDLEAAMKALHIERSAFHPVETVLAEAIAAGGRGAVASMPASLSIGFRFDPGNERAAAIIRRYSADLVTGLTEHERQLAREYLADGMAKGAHPRATALNLVGRENRVTRVREGGLIGLSAPQRAYVEAARAELSSADPALLRHFLTRKRRDRRYDKAVIKAIREDKALDPATAKVMTARYSARLIQLRGEMIARTESLPAIRAAKHEAYRQLVDDGRVEDQDIVRGWHTTTDGRQRDSHGEMNGQEVRGLGTPFESPSGARFLYPGDTSLGAGGEEVIACRCDESIAVKKLRWPL